MYTHRCGAKPRSVAQAYCHLLTCPLEAPRVLGLVMTQAAIEAAQRSSLTMTIRRTR